MVSMAGDPHLGPRRAVAQQMVVRHSLLIHGELIKAVAGGSPDRARLAQICAAMA